MEKLKLNDLFLAGLGLLFSKGEKSKKDQEKKDKVDEGRKEFGGTISFIKDLIERGKEQRNELRAKIKEEVESIVSEIGFVTKADLNKIGNEVNEIEGLL